MLSQRLQATILDWIQREGGPSGQVVSVDRHHPDLDLGSLTPLQERIRAFEDPSDREVVQDAKLDKIWGTAGPTAALNAFLQMSPEGEFVVENELKLLGCGERFHGYSQHIYLRRAQVTVPHSYFMQAAFHAMKS
ncbi:Rhamnosyl O-methyltransferase [Durusdinium trenchii]|uniref:Rhamnosyl O-methyltransferase n=1 Tax=Durusdinium trenchii TaxID=1381693 RepID=A0ABP0SRB8_9DINO